MTLIADIEAFASEYVPDGYELAADPRRPKAIHDNVWGTQILDPWEIDLLDTPLLQRLRGIRQTGLTHLTFPSTSQNRFEHTLGVVSVASTMFDELRARATTEQLQYMTDLDRKEVRLAALLHDTGHGVFSHASEDIVRADTEVMNELREQRLQGVGPYEAFSYLVARSDAFGQFLDRLRDKYPDALGDVGQDRLANLIVGKAARERDYLAAIISGPFDADKLGYIARDSRASGLELVTDVPRLRYAMQVGWIHDDGERAHLSNESDGEARNSLYIKWGSSSVLEQILFAKTQLYVIVYYHSKVRAAESLMRSALRLLRRDGYLTSAVDLLRLSDDALIRLARQKLATVDLPETALEAFERGLDRRLPQRAAVLMRGTYVDPEHQLHRMIGRRNRIDFEAGLARSIREVAGLPGETDVIVDLPPMPSLDEAGRSIVLSHDNHTVISMNANFPSEDWLTSYVVKKWKGHVFGPPQRGAAKAVHDAAVEVFREQLRIEIDESAGLIGHVEL